MTAVHRALARIITGDDQPDSYGWMITVDHLSNGPDDPDTCVGVSGPNNITGSMEARLKAGEGHAFRMYDGDGELYVEGLLIGDHEGEQGFYPLEDYGAGGMGCTEIRYKEGNSWVTL